LFRDCSAGAAPKSDLDFRRSPPVPNLYAALQQRLHKSGLAAGQVIFCAVQHHPENALGECQAMVDPLAEDRQLTPSKVGISAFIFDLDR
jgi:hypothetical protein